MQVYMHCSPLVCLREYCEAPGTDSVPKLSAKKCHFTLTWHKVWLYSPPPPALRNEKLADLELSSRVENWDFRFQCATLSLPPLEMKSWQIWRFESFELS